MKEFNTTGVCISTKHYMVDLTGQVREIRKPGLPGRQV